MKSVLKIALVVGVCAAPFVSLDAVAQNRPDTLHMSCRAASDLVRRSGAIVLSTGPNIYDRYVANEGFCERDEEARPQWLATMDTPQCFVGYYCERRTGNPSPD